VISAFSWLQARDRFEMGLRLFEVDGREMVIVCGVRIREWNIRWRISSGMLSKLSGSNDML